MKEYIAIDIGGTAIKYGIVNESEEIVFHDKTPTPKDGGPGIVHTVLSLIEEMRLHCTPQGVCISTAGMVDPERGVIFHASDTIPDYAGTNWKKLVESGCSLPCEVENDVNCAGLAEYISGAAMHAESCLCMTIGTGIGGCIITHGQIWHGHSMSACEIGYLPMYGSTFETLASTGALVRKVAAIKGHLGLDWDGEKIFAEARHGDRDCIEAIDGMCDVLGRGISTICYVLNPEIVVLGGGIMSQSAYLLPRIRSSMEKYLIDPISNNSFIASASHMNHAGMLGAFYHFRRMREE